MKKRQHGKRRLKLIKQLCALRKGEDALALGSFEFLQTEKDLLGYQRKHQNERITVFVNFGKKTKIVESMGEILLCRNYKDGNLRANGFVVFKETNLTGVIFALK